MSQPELVSAMTSSCHVQEPYIIDSHFTHFCDSYDIAGIYEGCPPLLEAISYSYPVLDANSPFQGDFCHDFLFSPCRKEEVYTVNWPLEEEQLPYNSWRNWASEHSSCFRFSDCWDDNLFSYANGSINNGHGSELGNAENSLQGEEETESFVSDYEIAEKHVCDNSHWPGYESWFGHLIEEDSDYKNRQEPIYSYVEEMELCEGIIGYWPCLMQKHPKAYGE